MRAPLRAPSRLVLRLVLGALALAAVAGIFGAIADGVVHGNGLTRFDVEIAQSLHRHARPPLTAAMRLVSDLNSTVAIGAYAAALAIFLARRRQWHRVAAVLLCIHGGMGVNVLMKLVFQRARPVFDDPFLTLSTYSFPSGHVAATTLFYGLIVCRVFAATERRRWRWAAVAGWLLAVVLVACSRMVLGVHYLSDVVAAFAEGVIWLAVCLGSLAAYRRRPSSPHSPASDGFRGTP